MATIRFADANDAAAVQAIYAPYVLNTAITFEMEPPAVAAMAQRIDRTLTSYPWLVYEDDGGVRGYAYGSRHRERAAYQWSADASIYLDPAIHRLGVGRALYTALFGLLHEQGFYTVYASVTLPNPASVGLHESMGFAPIGVYRAVGHKLDAWQDVGWWSLALRAPAGRPTPPVPITVLRDQKREVDALAAGMALLRS